MWAGKFPRVNRTPFSLLSLEGAEHSQTLLTSKGRLMFICLSPSQTTKTSGSSPQQMPWQRSLFQIAVCPF